MKMFQKKTITNAIEKTSREQKVDSQVKDDPELLDLMLKDTDKASELYKPSTFWAAYKKKFLPELNKYGLHDFRSRRDSVIEAFGGTDHDPIYDAISTRKFGGRSPIARWGIHPRSKLKFLIMAFRNLLKLKWFRDSINLYSYWYYGMSLEQKQLLVFEHAKYYGKANKAKSISDVSSSLVGNPESMIVVNGKPYTDNFVRYYTMYAFASKSINFDLVQSVLELGTGIGGQLEVIKKLHPHLTYYIIDIPPQLYVCEQYLKEVFPDDVISYRETRNMKQIPEVTNGKIFIFAPWQLPNLKNLSYDVFWNSASLQEMDPPIVENYLGFANSQTKKYIFLNALDAKRDLIRIKNKVSYGVGFEDYKKFLSNFELIDKDKIMPPSRDSELGSLTLWKNKSLKSF